MKNSMKQKLTVVKIGGNIIDSPSELAAFVRDFARLEGRKVLVHGGGAVASDMLRGLGIEPQMTGGRRITDEQTLRVVTMVYAGWINKSIVAALQAEKCNAIGLSGADGGAVLATRRPAEPVDYGYVGDISHVDGALLETLMAQGLVPVICAITHDGHGGLLNTNADTIASAVAVALVARNTVQLVYCFEKRGVLADPSDDTSALPTLGLLQYEAMKTAGSAKAGILPKLDNAFAALRGGVAEVVIKHASDLLAEDTGTTLTII
ncbi:MAG: acetylglutamate kinase [Rikenellaceae bacterium]|nr:acetylglutamate kinase [Rikenellaceae bacterium]MCL2692076.1 acetylglutamate kinase [Rikenellaceae bacterium]